MLIRPFFEIRAGYAIIPTDLIIGNSCLAQLTASQCTRLLFGPKPTPKFQFYNSEAVCSDLINFSDVALDKRSYSDVDFRTTFNFTVSTNLVWCLREEPLEIQVGDTNLKL